MYTNVQLCSITCKYLLIFVQFIFMHEGNLFNKHLIKKGLTHAKAAEMLGLKSRSSISDYIKKEVFTPRTRAKLNKVFDF